MNNFRTILDDLFTGINSYNLSLQKPNVATNTLIL